jgi:type II protein arginine methyltransferase
MAQEVITCANGISRDHVVNINETGRLDALVAWFDLHLHEHLTVTTSPLKTEFEKAKCWEQAVYPITSHHLRPEGWYH